MARSRTTTSAPPPKPDRWGTLNAFAREKLAGLTAGSGSSAAGCLWYTLFTLADGKSGLIRGASIDRLVGMTGMARNTVKTAMKVLLAGGFLTVSSSARVPTYLMAHAVKES